MRLHLAPASTVATATALLPSSSPSCPLLPLVDRRAPPKSYAKTLVAERIMSGRSVHAKAILGQELYGRLSHIKVLLVGAGGIGCELRAYSLHHRKSKILTLLCGCACYPKTRLLGHPVKNIVLTGFGDITLLDLDTIDLSNLNRQFLFRKKDVKQSKAMVRTLTLLHPCFSATNRRSCYHVSPLQVASKTASAFNPNVKITPIHANIKEPQFDVAWFSGFDIVLNALDNLGKSPLLRIWLMLFGSFSWEIAGVLFEARFGLSGRV